MPYGCYDAVTGAQTSNDGGSDILSNVMHAYTNTGSDVCFNSRIHYGFLSLLLVLQVLTIIWFGMICRVAYGVLCGRGAEDSRSDDEGDEDEDEEIENQFADDKIIDFVAQKEPELALLRDQPLEEEVGVEELRFNNIKKKGANGVAVAAAAAAAASSTVPARRSKGRASGISIPGHGDHKELLGRIGCDKPS